MIQITILTLKTHNLKKELKQISILITVLSHIFASTCLFAFLFFLVDNCFFFHEQSGFIRNYRMGALDTT